MGETKVALVAGGSGGIGEGIVAALMGAGYRVYVPTREGDQSPRLQKYVEGLGELRPVAADLSDEGDVTAMRDHIVAEEGRIDAAVVSVGSYYFGYRMHRMPREDWDRSVRDNLVTHFNLQRAFIDQMRRQDHGAYVTLTGPEAETILPDEGVMSIMAAAQRMMSKVIAHESFDSSLRVHSITVLTSIRTRSRGQEANPDWISARDLGSYVAALIEGTVPGAGEVVHELRDHDHVAYLLERSGRT